MSKRIRFVATHMLARDLQPGDAFSTVGPDYWDNPAPGALGERVYLRTNSPTPDSQRDQEIYRITIADESPVSVQTVIPSPTAEPGTPSVADPTAAHDAQKATSDPHQAPQDHPTPSREAPEGSNAPDGP